MAEAAKPLPGPQRAAIFLLCLGEERAAEVLRFMEPEEMESVGTAMAELGRVPRAEVANVVGGFLTDLEDQASFGVGVQDYMRGAVLSALGPQRGGAMLTRILAAERVGGLETARWMDAQTIAQVIGGEHPQIVALVLAHLSAEQAAEVAQRLAPELRNEVILRLAMLRDVPPAALAELDRVLERQFSGANDVQTLHLNGLNSTAGVLNAMRSEVENEVLEKIRELDPELGQQIDDAMFLFEQLGQISDRGIQALLREVQSETLVVALKGASDTLREKIFRNMSSRAADLLRDDLESLGPVKLADVEGAQKTIIASARQLAESGQIQLGGEESYV